MLPALAGCIAAHPAYVMKLLVPHLAHSVFVEVSYRSTDVAEALGFLQQAQMERSLYSSPPPHALPLDKAAEMARASSSTLLTWVRKGYLHCWKAGSECFFALPEIRAFMLRKGKLRKWHVPQPMSFFDVVATAARFDHKLNVTAKQRDEIFKSRMDCASTISGLLDSDVWDVINTDPFSVSYITSPRLPLPQQL
jgi:hypothetical protein